MSRVICHLDMDAFFSSVEQLSNPGLKGKPVIVCGDPYRRSVVSTASYEARKYGLKSGMPIGLARKLCPKGIFVSGNPKKYVYTSVRILGLLREFTPLVEPFSVDEAFLGFNNLTIDESIEVAGDIKRNIRDRYNLTCSIGIGSNKIIAKMASGFKKPDGLTVIREGEFLLWFGDMEVNNLWGVGEKTVAKLEPLGIRSIRDLAGFPEKALRAIFGEYGSYLKMAANGFDETPIIPFYEGLEPKSVGHEYTFPFDTSDGDYLRATLLRLSEQVGRRMRKEGYLCNTVTIKIRDRDFNTITRQKKYGHYFERDDIIFKIACGLFHTNYSGEEIRLLGVSSSGLIKKEAISVDPLFDNDRRHAFFIKVIDSIRDKYGEDAVKRGATIRG